MDCELPLTDAQRLMLLNLIKEHEMNSKQNIREKRQAWENTKIKFNAICIQIDIRYYVGLYDGALMNRMFLCEIRYWKSYIIRFISKLSFTIGSLCCKVNM